DVSIRVHLIERSGNHKSADIESCNPFFGCDVRFFDWIDHTVVLIDREKNGEPSGVSRRVGAWSRRLTPLGVHAGPFVRTLEGHFSPAIGLRTRDVKVAA